MGGASSRRSVVSNICSVQFCSHKGSNACPTASEYTLSQPYKPAGVGATRAPILCRRRMGALVLRRIAQPTPGPLNRSDEPSLLRRRNVVSQKAAHYPPQTRILLLRRQQFPFRAAFG